MFVCCVVCVFCCVVVWLCVVCCVCCVLCVVVVIVVVIPVVYTVCARSTPVLFSSDAIHGERQHCSLRGHSSHDEHPWVKTVQATLSGQQKTLQRDVTGCARATDSRVRTHQRARRSSE